MSNKSSSKVKKVILHTMNNIYKICLRICLRISKITLLELCWTVVGTIIIFILWTKNYDVKENTLNPVILWWTSNFPGTSEVRYCPDDIKCDVFSNKNVNDLYNVEAYLFYGSNINFDDLPLPRLPEKLIWGLYHEESPRNVEEMMHEEVLTLFNFSATFSRYSDVPFPLQYFQSTEDVTSLKYFVTTEEKKKHLEDISPVIYLQTDCETSTERDAYIKELMKFIKIDSYGSCLNNKQLPAELTEDYLNHLQDDQLFRFIARYKFVIAIENGVCNDYVTEKFWRAIKIGTVPIYFGSPLIRDWLPNNNSAVLLDDYPTPKSMSEHLSKLLEDDSLYETYLEHKTKGLITNEKLLFEIKTRPYQMDTLNTAREFECFICKKLHDKSNGEMVESIVNKRHYDCPKPISALSLTVNPSNSWVSSYEIAKRNAHQIRRKITMT